MAASASATPSPPIQLSALKIRRSNDTNDPGVPIPKSAVRVFMHEAKPKSVRVNDDTIAVDYGISGVLFDRANGQPVRRFTVADGWPSVGDPAFGTPQTIGEVLVGPGVAVMPPALRMLSNSAVARAIAFDGKLWRAIQPDTKP